MTDIYSGLPKKFKACFSPTDLTDTSYLSSDEKVMRDYFFIKKTSDKDFSSLYILSAPVDAGRRSVINTALRSALLIHKKGYRDTLQLILQGERYLSLREFIEMTSSDPAGISGDLAFIFRHISREPDQKLQKEMKIRVLSDLLEFISEDDEMKILMNAVYPSLPGGIM